MPRKSENEIEKLISWLVDGANEYNAGNPFKMRIVINRPMVRRKIRKLVREAWWMGYNGASIDPNCSNKKLCDDINNRFKDRFGVNP